MPHIHTSPNQHDHTATGYIIRTDTPEPLALLHMHKKLGVLLPIGGHIELHETPWQAMAHELVEESGYTLDQLQILQPPHVLSRLTSVAMHPYPLVLNTHAITNDRFITGEHFHSDIAYGFTTAQDPVQAIGEGESADVRWLSAADLQKLPETIIRPNTKEVYTFMLETALKKWHQVSPKNFAL